MCNEEKGLTELLTALKAVRLELARPGTGPLSAMEKQIAQRQKTLQSGKRSGSLSPDEEFAQRSAIAALEAEKAILTKATSKDGAAAFALLKKDYDDRVKALKNHAEQGKKALSHMFRFCEEVFPEGQEMVILVTELTISYYGARFISRYGCEEYFAHNKELLFYERQKEIISQLEALAL